jgi:hypothetical protein
MTITPPISADGESRVGVASFVKDTCCAADRGSLCVVGHHQRASIVSRRCLKGFCSVHCIIDSLGKMYPQQA